MFFIRNSKMIGRKHYFLANIQDEEDSEILSLYNELAIRSKQSILYSMKDLDANNDYFKYYNSRYMEIRRYHQLVDTINIWL